MPRTIDYPRASLARCLELAGAIHGAGDDCTLARAAERFGARPGGTFNAIVSAARRYGFVTIRRGRLRTTPGFRAYRLAYDAPERERVLADSIANVPLFRALLARYAGAPLPANLARVLVREHSVAERSAERVAGHLLEALRAAGLLVGNIVRRADTSTARASDPPPSARSSTESRARAHESAAPSRTFRVHVSGPGIESHLDVRDADDVELVRALVAKIARAVDARELTGSRDAVEPSERRDPGTPRD